jgi:activator of 2-hydroxyglutaryl-CoA dehydratase
MQQHWRTVSLSEDQPLGLGIDLGSISLNVAVTDETGRLLAESYDRHQGQPVETTIRVLEELFERIDPSRFQWMVGTGSAGRRVCELMGIPFVNELICQAVAVKRVAPDVRTLIEMGGQDSKILFLPGDANPDLPILDFAMNTNCAAGTGSFLDQQASRIGINIEDEFGELALKSENPPRVAGRCSVFAKTDMIHLQQQATPMHDIVAGLCLGLARNLKSNLGRGYEFSRPMAFVGGVAANKGRTATRRPGRGGRCWCGCGRTPPPPCPPRVWRGCDNTWPRASPWDTGSSRSSWRSRATRSAGSGPKTRCAAPATATSSTRTWASTSGRSARTWP